MGKSCRPTCVTLGMDLDPNLATQFAQLDCSGPPGKAEVQVAAPRMARQLTFAADDDAALTTGGYRVLSRQCEIELDQRPSERFNTRERLSEFLDGS